MEALEADNVSESDKLMHLIIKYETLEHKFRIVLLENEQYKKHITELDEEIINLKEDVLCYQDNADTEKAQLPVLEAHLSSMHSELDETDRQIAYLTDTLHEYSTQMKALRSENEMLQQQIDELNEYVVRHQKTKCQNNVSETTMSPSAKHFKILLEENEYLHNELDAMQSSFDLYASNERGDEELSRMTESYSSSKSPSPILEENETIRVNIAQNSSSDPTDREDTPIFAKHLKTQTYGSFNFKDISQQPMFFNLGTSQASISPILMDDVVLKLQKLENQNNELLQKMERLEDENKDLRQNLERINTSEMANDDDAKVECDEDEDLFEKYNIKIEIPRNTLIEKFRFLGYELQLRRLTQ